MTTINTTTSTATCHLFNKYYVPNLSSVQFSCSVVSNSLQPHGLCTPGFPGHHQLLKLAETHVHRVSDPIQPSHPVVPLSSCLQSFPASVSNELTLCIRWPKYWSFSFIISLSNEYSGLRFPL